MNRNELCSITKWQLAVASGLSAVAVLVYGRGGTCPQFCSSYPLVSWARMMLHCQILNTRKIDDIEKIMLKPY